MDPARAITAVTFPPVAAFAWLCTQFIFRALAACSHRLRAAVARHLRPCLTAGWMGLAALVWGAISLGTGTGEAVFLLGEKCRSAAPDVRSAAPLDFAGPTSGADSAVIERPRWSRAILANASR
jgi:hypothetical protein